MNSKVYFNMLAFAHFCYTTEDLKCMVLDTRNGKRSTVVHEYFLRSNYKFLSLGFYYYLAKLCTSYYM